MKKDLNRLSIAPRAIAATFCFALLLLPSLGASSNTQASGATASLPSVPDETTPDTIPPDGWGTIPTPDTIPPDRWGAPPTPDTTDTIPTPDTWGAPPTPDRWGTTPTPDTTDTIPTPDTWGAPPTPDTTDTIPTPDTTPP